MINRRTVFQRMLSAFPLMMGSFSVTPRVFSKTPEQVPKVINFFVPQVAGGSNDVFARAVAARLAKWLEVSVIVENRPGANGNIGSSWFAKSAPRDGSAWLVTVNSSLTINPHLYSKPGFDARADFVPVSGIAIVQHVLLARSDFPVNSLEDLLQRSRQRPGKDSYGSSGNGTFSHLLMEQLKQIQKIEITHVPYKGVSPALMDLIGGEIQYAISTVPAAMPFIKSGQLKALAVPSLTRTKALPDVPLAKDVVPSMVGDLWIALYAPKDTPPEIVSHMSAAMRGILQLPETQAFMESQGASPLLAGSKELQTLTASELDRWGAIVKAIGLRLD